MMEVIWHQKALDQLEETLNYCLKQFGKKVAERVANKIDRDIILLSQNPYIGGVEEVLQGSSCFRSIVEGPSKLIYTVEDDFIFIHLFWDCRQDPDRMSEYLD